MLIGSLFSGIGGLELGLEWAGLGSVAWQVEIDPFCRSVLERHWPDATRFDDVRTVGTHNLAPVDLICGGFPCQDISVAGGGIGLDGERSGLWREFERIIRELRPRFVVVENVAALLERGMGTVLSGLASLGYDAEWSCVSACSVGAPHVRRRLFIVAYANGINGRPGIRHCASRSIGPLQARDGFEGARARFGARLADPSALYAGADGLPVGVGAAANHAIGNAVSPEVGYLVGCVVREIAAAIDVQSSAA